MNQSQALDILKSGENVFLTGSAGAGKTYVLNQYIEYLRERSVPVAITASTGIAATHIDGQTIHSWSGVGVRDEISPMGIAKILKNKAIKDQISNAQVLIIDEISMLSRKLLECVDQVLQHAKVSMEPFGGMQIIFAGDFFQLPPISRTGESSKEKFAFMSPSWLAAGPQICYLETQYRQTDDALLGVLRDIRTREVSDETIQALNSKLSDRDVRKEGYARLFTHNSDVDRINDSMLGDIKWSSKEFDAIFTGKKNLIEMLKKSVLAPQFLTLKKNARVMFVKNNYEAGYINGTMGYVVNFTKKDGYPMVLTDAGETIVAKPADWHIEDETGKLLAGCVQVPLRLAWAITIHKSQGMTLDRAQMDLSRTFESGQGYVALSRVKTWEGLELAGFNQRALEVDSLVYHADQRFLELSKESQAWLSQQENIEEMKNNFILRSWGTLDPVAIKENHAKMQEPKSFKVEPKISTYEKTKKLVLKEMSISAMSAERVLSEDTIVAHLSRLIQQFPDLDISYMKPDTDTVALVRDAMIECEMSALKDDYDKEGRLKLGLIHRELAGALDYSDIRLARIFIDLKKEEEE